jgi:asparagine synthase (glutamine-hydrolysing)
LTGICGIVNLDGGPVDPEAIRVMVGAAAHRAPDGSHSWLSQNAALAHLALKLTPEEQQERQPVAEGNLVVSADARIDNRAELITQLSAAAEHLDTDRPSDARLILAAYRRWGSECASHLVGDYAFAVFDGARRRLLAARDPMGLRPFHYLLTPTRLVFASEVAQVLTHPEVPVRINERMIAAYLTSQPAPLHWTFYEGITQLPPGHALLVEPGQRRRWRYWDIDPGRQLRYQSDDEYADHFRELFKQAVRSRLRSVRPVGLLLSGGMDSGSIAATTGWLLERERLAIPDFRTYCWAFEHVQACDERQVSRITTERYRLPVSDIRAEDALKNFPRHGLHRDEPSLFIYQALHEQSFARARAEGVSLMMSGVRGDLLVGVDADLLGLLTAGKLGELRDALSFESRTHLRLPRTAVKHLLLPALLSFWPPQRLSPLRRRLWGRVVGWQRVRPRPEWLRPEFADAAGLADLAATPEAPAGIRASARRQRYETIFAAIQMRVVAQMERNTARFGMGFADAWSDRRLIEFVLATPQWRLHQERAPKRLARLAMAGVMPEEARHRVGKSSLQPLYFYALRAARPAILQLIAHSQAAARGYLIEEKVRDLYEAICRGERGVAGLWEILALEMWLREYWR